MKFVLNLVYSSLVLLLALNCFAFSAQDQLRFESSEDRFKVISGILEKNISLFLESKFTGQNLVELYSPVGRILSRLGESKQKILHYPEVSSIKFVPRRDSAKMQLEEISPVIAVARYSLITEDRSRVKLPYLPLVDGVKSFWVYRKNETAPCGFVTVVTIEAKIDDVFDAQVVPFIYEASLPELNNAENEEVMNLIFAAYKSKWLLYPMKRMALFHNLPKSFKETLTKHGGRQEVRPRASGIEIPQGINILKNFPDIPESRPQSELNDKIIFAYVKDLPRLVETLESQNRIALISKDNEYVFSAEIAARKAYIQAIISSMVAASTKPEIKELQTFIHFPNIDLSLIKKMFSEKIFSISELERIEQQYDLDPVTFVGWLNPIRRAKIIARRLYFVGKISGEERRKWELLAQKTFLELDSIVHVENVANSHNVNHFTYEQRVSFYAQFELLDYLEISIRNRLAKKFKELFSKMEYSQLGSDLNQYVALWSQHVFGIVKKILQLPNQGSVHEKVLEGLERQVIIPHEVLVLLPPFILRTDTRVQAMRVFGGYRQIPESVLEVLIGLLMDKPREGNEAERKSFEAYLSAIRLNAYLRTPEILQSMLWMLNADEVYPAYFAGNLLQDFLDTLKNWKELSSATIDKVFYLFIRMNQTHKFEVVEKIISFMNHKSITEKMKQGYIIDLNELIQTQTQYDRDQVRNIKKLIKELRNCDKHL